MTEKRPRHLTPKSRAPTFSCRLPSVYATPACFVHARTCNTFAWTRIHAGCSCRRVNEKGRINRKPRCTAFYEPYTLPRTRCSSAAPAKAA